MDGTLPQSRHNFGRQIGRLARLWRTELDNRLRPLGLSQARWLLLVHLHEAPDGLMQLDLAERAGVTGATLVRQIDRLEGDGLVERREDPDDRRAKRVRLTPKGERMFGDVDRIAGELRREVLAGFDPRDVEAAALLAEELIRRLDGLAAADGKGAS